MLSQLSYRPLTIQTTNITNRTNIAPIVALKQPSMQPETSFCPFVIVVPLRVELNLSLHQSDVLPLHFGTIQKIQWTPAFYIIIPIPFKIVVTMRTIIWWRQPRKADFFVTPATNHVMGHSTRCRNRTYITSCFVDRRASTTLTGLLACNFL